MYFSVRESHRGVDPFGRQTGRDQGGPPTLWPVLVTVGRAEGHDGGTRLVPTRGRRGLGAGQDSATGEDLGWVDGCKGRTLESPRHGCPTEVSPTSDGPDPTNLLYGPLPVRGSSWSDPPPSGPVQDRNPVATTTGRGEIGVKGRDVQSDESEWGRPRVPTTPSSLSLFPVILKILDPYDRHVSSPLFRPPISVKVTRHPGGWSGEEGRTQGELGDQSRAYSGRGCLEGTGGTDFITVLGERGVGGSVRETEMGVDKRTHRVL